MEVLGVCCISLVIYPLRVSAKPAVESLFSDGLQDAAPKVLGWDALTVTVGGPRNVSPIMENQMEKMMEDEMVTSLI